MGKYVIEEDVIQASIESKQPSQPRDFSVAKTILQQRSKGSGESLYDHLTALLSKVINDRPPNVMDYFEEFSRKISQERIKTENSLLANTYVEPQRLKCAKALLPCLIDRSDHQEEISSRFSDFLHLQFYWSLAGCGLPRAQIFALSCSIGKLAENPSIKSCRFWGRIMGIRLDYYIVEANLTAEEKMNQKSDWTNQRIYFVCNGLGDEWVQLPNVTQEQIGLSEKIAKFFTGNLEAKVPSPFSGTENNLLRALIHRITTETYVAPVGYHQINEGEVSINSNYEETESNKLLNLEAWNHYRLRELTLCSQNSKDSICSWSIRRTQKPFPNTAMVVIRSNTWPGALSFSSKREHDSVYMGWGMKYINKAYVPDVSLAIQNEYDFSNKAANN